MGQSYLIANLDRREYIYPHALGDGYKLLEFSGGLTMTALAVLLADGNGRGGGDLVANDPAGEKRVVAVAGRWKGERVVVAGDYADSQPGSEQNVYTEATAKGGPWRDISLDVIEALAADCYLRRRIAEAITPRHGDWTLPGAYFNKEHPDHARACRVFRRILANDARARLGAERSRE